MTLATPRRSAKEQFDKQAGEYNSQWNEWSKATLDWLVDHSDASENETVLDVATGTGFTALAFAGRVERVAAVDVSDGMLAEARKRAAAENVLNVEFQAAPAEKLLFGDGSFDIVTCRIAAHHFLDIRAFLSEACRVLRTGGRLMIVDTTVPDDFTEAAAWQNAVEVVRDPSHIRNYSPNEWNSLLAEARFTVKESTIAGSGITIPLDDWIRKAGCTPDQEQAVRAAFHDAPHSARAEFQIQGNPLAPGSWFTWQRIGIRAEKQS